MTRKRGRTGLRLPAGFGTIWTTVAVDLIGFGIVLPILPLYAERFGASPAKVGLLLSSFSVAQVLMAPVWGRLSDRYGRKPVLLVSLFGTAIGSFLTGAATTLWLLFIGRLVDGASGASVSVAQAAVADLAPEEQRPHLFGLLGAAFGVGFVLGPAIGALAAFVGPRVPFYLAGSVALLNAVVALRRLPETATVRAAVHPADRAQASSNSVPTTLSAKRANAVLWRLAAVAFIAMLAFSGFEATFALFGQRRFHLSLSSTGGVFTVIGLVLVGVQGGLVRPTVKRLGPEQTLRLGLGLNVVGLAALAAAHNWGVLIAALVLLVVGQGLATPTITTLVASRAGEVRRGAALGVQQAASGAARIIGPSGAGALFGHAGVAVPYAAGAGLTAAAVGLLGALGRLDERDPGPIRSAGSTRVASEVTDR